MLPCQCIKCHLRRLIAYREERLEMGRLDEKFAKAGGVVGRTEKRIEDRLDVLIGRETEIEKKTDEVFARQMAPIDEANQALDALDAKLNLLSNGGPTGPLPGSGSTPPPAPPSQPQGS